MNPTPWMGIGVWAGWLNGATPRKPRRELALQVAARLF